ncbi:capsular polysaccharide synthesis protein [Bifidobacterium aquikefiri]|uniref:Polysaccharide biosynthesis protein n=1 Tax=Bifidobacterium aquikefiri TaxID=1653207 RepID=A0A261G7Z5_9BIFI|nr:capsular polysaccharide synthesis protein [Bifidobacterium aquikefiri]OZG67557.1 polysaccharide biosynthesis protein [Bifidobacterium aquikefiri]
MRLTQKITNKFKQIFETSWFVYQKYGLVFALQRAMTYLPFVSDVAYYSKLRDRLFEEVCCKVPIQQSSSNHACINDGPVWLMWWQGIDDTTPYLVRRCIDSIQRNANNRTVHIISRENYKQFIQIPLPLLSKIQSGTISMTNLSDYMRFKLLYEHGGVWLDASAYLSNSLSSEIMKYDFYSASRLVDPPSGAFSKHWTFYFIAGKEGNPLFKYVIDCYEQYWKTENRLIDYFMCETFLKIAYQHFVQFREMINNVPINNVNTLALQSYMNLSSSRIPPIDNTYIHKLTYKRPYKTKLFDGSLTVYGQLINYGTINIE